MSSPLRNPKTIQYFFLFIVIGMTFYGLSNRNIRNAKTDKSKRPLTSLPVTYSLATVLGQEVLPAPIYLQGPASLDQHKSYFADQDSTLAQILKDAGIVVSLQGAWPEDPLYPLARRHKIRIVHIDAAGSMSPNNGRISLLEEPSTTQPGKLSPYVWQSFRGAIEMGEVIAADFCRLYPRKKKTFQRHLNRVREELMTSRNDIAKRYAALPDARVIALTPTFVYLTDEMNIPVVDYVAPDISSDDLVDLMRKDDVRVALADGPGSPELSQALAADNRKLVIMNPILSVGADDAEAYFRLLGENHAKLLDALSTESVSGEEEEVGATNPVAR